MQESPERESNHSRLTEFRSESLGAESTAHTPQRTRTKGWKMARDDNWRRVREQRRDEGG